MHFPKKKIYNKHFTPLSQSLNVPLYFVKTEGRGREVKWCQEVGECTVCDVTGGRVFPIDTSLLLTPDISVIPTRPASIVLRETFHSFSSGRGKGKNREQGGREEQKKKRVGV